MTSSPFTVTGTVIGPPTITGFSPAKGPVGTSVVITGTNFSTASTVTFHGVSATFTVNSATQINATVPLEPHGSDCGDHTRWDGDELELVHRCPDRRKRAGIAGASGRVSQQCTGAGWTRRDHDDSSDFQEHQLDSDQGPFLRGDSAVGREPPPQRRRRAGRSWSKLTPGVGADGILTPGEAFTTSFVIGLQSPHGFSFFVDLWGETSP